MVGVKGRGGSHIGAFAGRKDTLITYIVDADKTIGQQRVTEIAKRQGASSPSSSRTCARRSTTSRSTSSRSPRRTTGTALPAIWAMQAGKDVYVEKPVSHNVSEGRRMVEAARKYKQDLPDRHAKPHQSRHDRRRSTFVHVGQDRQGQGRPRPVLQAARLDRRQGRISDVPRSVDYDLWCGPAPMLPLTRQKLHYDWHWLWDYGNGDLGNQGIHQMDIARWGLGVNDAQQRRVQLRRPVRLRRRRRNRQHAGRRPRLRRQDAGLRSPRPEDRATTSGAKVGVIFEGTDGYVVLPSYDGGAAFDKDGKHDRRSSRAAATTTSPTSSRPSAAASIDDLNADIVEGHLSSALCHLGNISYRLGSKMSADELDKSMATMKTADNAKDTLERTLKHLADNGVDMAATSCRSAPR